VGGTSMNADLSLETPPVDVTARATPSTAKQDFVIREVLKRLGTPRSLYRVTAMNVWKNHFRVNVYCQSHTGEALTPVVMTDSFFVDVVGEEIVAQPPIQPRYRGVPVSPTAAV
jgi:hypothetical protein